MREPRACGVAGPCAHLTEIVHESLIAKRREAHGQRGVGHVAESGIADVERADVRMHVKCRGD